MRDNLRRHVESLEIPELALLCRCGCPGVTDDPPTICGCILAADHNVPADEWAQLLLICEPQEYGARPLPEEATGALPGVEKVQVLAQRAAARVSLWHPDDAHANDAPRLVRDASRGRSGAVNPLGLRIYRGGDA